jgi:uncharacterized protein (DUF1697 family)
LRTRQVALLRGVNLGPSTRVDMAALRALFGRLGYDDVRTVLMSGNVVYTTDDTPEHATKRIEAALPTELGLSVRVLVRTRDELAAAVKNYPLHGIAADGSRTLVVFLSAKSNKNAVRDLDPQQFEPEVFTVGDREVYVWSPHGLQKVKLNIGFWEKTFQCVATGRNWNTVNKLLAVAEA